MKTDLTGTSNLVITTVKEGKDKYKIKSFPINIQSLDAATNTWTEEKLNDDDYVLIYEDYTTSMRRFRISDKKYYIIIKYIKEILPI